MGALDLDGVRRHRILRRAVAAVAAVLALAVAWAWRDEIGAAVHHARRGNGQAQAADQRQLPGLRGVDRQGGGVDDASALSLPVREQALGVEDRMFRLTQKGRHGYAA